MRQAYFVAFERTAHDMVAQGGTTTDLANSYMTCCGNNSANRCGYRRIPVGMAHDSPPLKPFYCYAYSFGNLLVLALYPDVSGARKLVRAEISRAARGGRVKAPRAILAEVGVDMNSQTFWQSGFDAISGMVDQLEQTMR